MLEVHLRTNVKRGIGVKNEDEDDEEVENSLDVGGKGNQVMRTM